MYIYQEIPVIKRIKFYYSKTALEDQGAQVFYNNKKESHLRILDDSNQPMEYGIPMIEMMSRPYSYSFTYDDTGVLTNVNDDSYSISPCIPPKYLMANECGRVDLSFKSLVEGQGSKYSKTILGCSVNNNYSISEAVKVMKDDTASYNHYIQIYNEDGNIIRLDKEWCALAVLTIDTIEFIFGYDFDHEMPQS